MRLSTAVFAVSLLVLTIAATSIPPGAAQARVGEIVLDPSHAVPGTLVSFKGVGWHLPLIQGTGVTTCLVYGDPVKIDNHAICNVLTVNGIYEPVGTFVVANLAAGTCKIYISSDIDYYGNLVGSQDFTVDGPPVAEVTLIAVATTTMATLVTSYPVVTTALTPTPVLTVTSTVTTTKAESPTAPQALNYTSFLSPLSIVAILVWCACVLVAVVVLRRRKKPPS